MLFRSQDNNNNGSSDFASFDDYSFPAHNGYNFSPHSAPKLDDFADFGGAVFEPATLSKSPEIRSPRGGDPVTFDDFDFDTLNLQPDT